MDPMDVQNAAGTMTKAATKKSPLLLACVGVVAAAAVGGGAYVYTHSQPKEEAPAPKIGYAKTVAILDENDVEEYTPPDAITLEYKNDATSTDGKNFKCFIANAAENTYDMYIDIYADAALTDQIFLSELLRPGTGFETIELKKALPVGSYQVYTVFTQVEPDQSTLHNQTVVTQVFTVKDPSEVEPDDGLPDTLPDPTKQREGQAATSP